MHSKNRSVGPKPCPVDHICWVSSDFLSQAAGNFRRKRTGSKSPGSSDLSRLRGAHFLALKNLSIHQLHLSTRSASKYLCRILSMHEGHAINIQESMAEPHIYTYLIYIYIHTFSERSAITSCRTVLFLMMGKQLPLFPHKKAQAIAKLHRTFWLDIT